MNLPTIYIYTTQVSERLRYVLQWIFDEQIGLNWQIITSLQEYRQDAPLINYTAAPINIASIHIRPGGLLFEKGISKQEIALHRWKHSTILFYNQPGAPVPFDIFAATFYLLSRYEEYLPARKDKHGRFPHTESVAHRFSFLKEPVIDQWILHFRKTLARQYNIKLPFAAFRYRPTYDIDMAWSVLYKGRKRVLGAQLRDLSRLKLRPFFQRLKVLKGSAPDPFDSFDSLDRLHEAYGLRPVYFFLLGIHSAFDKNISRDHPAMRQLIKRMAAKYTIGIHPSYLSNTHPGQLKEEIHALQQISGRPVTNSRQHYIKLLLPDTYEQLIANGILDDFSMGYASANGFRAGTSRSFLWYHLREEKTTSLRVHPFSFMEVTSKVYERHNTDAAFREWEQLYAATYKVGGTFTVVFHNHTLGSDPVYKGWYELYESMLKRMKDDGAI